MFKKILIAEDHEVLNFSVQRTVQELNIPVVDHVFYCDDALEKVKKSLREGAPYDLLITDLHYDSDHYEQKIKSGRGMICEIRKLMPSLKVIVFSAEHKPGVIDELFTEYGIDGFVRKGRQDSKQLIKAIRTVDSGEKFLAPETGLEMKKLNRYEISTFNMKVISLLASGVFQKDIPDHLKKENIEPNSLSTIEKRLNQLKEELGVKTNEQLIAFCKDLGVI
jgi:DNA-binding NarL/FixJ family response regulator